MSTFLHSRRSGEHSFRHQTDRVRREIVELTEQIEWTKSSCDSPETAGLRRAIRRGLSAESLSTEEDRTELCLSSSEESRSMHLSELLTSESVCSHATRIYEKSFLAAQRARARLQSRYLMSGSTFDIAVPQKARSATATAVDLRSIRGVAEHLARRKPAPPPPPDPPMERAVLPNPPPLTPSVERIATRLSAEIDLILRVAA
jgi:hypothetical protein